MENGLISLTKVIRRSEGMERGPKGVSNVDEEAVRRRPMKMTSAW